jgi:hypothetical protein
LEFSAGIIELNFDGLAQNTTILTIPIDPKAHRVCLWFQNIVYIHMRDGGYKVELSFITLFYTSLQFE